MKYKLNRLDKDSNQYKLGLRYQIEALKDFNDVKRGDVGGYVTNEYNLSQLDTCWLYDNSQMYGDSRVKGCAEMHNNSKMYGKSQMHNTSKMFDKSRIHNNSKMFGNSKMLDNAKMFDNSQMRNNSKMFNKSRMYDNSKMFDNSQMYNNTILDNNSKMYDDSIIFDNAKMYGASQMYGRSRMWDNSEIHGYCKLHGVLFKDFKLRDDAVSRIITNVGSANDSLTINQDTNGNVFISRGCFKGTLGEFREEVINKNDNDIWKNKYLKIIDNIDAFL